MLLSDLLVYERISQTREHIVFVTPSVQAIDFDITMTETTKTGKTR